METLVLVLAAVVLGSAFAASPLRFAFPWLIIAMVVQGFFVVDVGILWLPSYTLAAVLLARAWLAGLFPLPPLPGTKPVKAMLLLAAVSVIVAIYLRPAFLAFEGDGDLRFGIARPLIQMAALFLVASGYFVAVACSRKRDMFRRTLTLVIHVGTAVAALAIYEQIAYYLDLPMLTELPGKRRDATASFTLQGRTLLRSSGTFLEPGHLGRYLVSTVLLSISLLLSREGRKEYGALKTGIVLQLVGLALTFSTAAFFGIATGVLVMLLVTRSRARFIASSLLAGILLFVAGSLLAARLDVPGSPTELFGERSGQTIEAEFEALQHSPEGFRRVDYWRASLEMLKRYPVTGVGIGNFGIAAAASDDDLLPNAGSYGLVWGWIGEFGILGLLLYAWFVLAFVGGMVRAHRQAEGHHPELVGFLAAFVAMMIHYLSSGYIRMEIDSWILLGVAMAAVHQSRRSRERNGSWRLAPDPVPGR